MTTDSGGKSAGKWILISVVIAAVLLFVCCGGCAMVVQFGLGEVSGQTQAVIEDHPVILEHIGEIEDFDFSWGETINRQEGGQQRFAFELKGSKGSGVLSAVVDSDQAPVGVYDAVLEVNGETYELTEE